MTRVLSASQVSTFGTTPFGGITSGCERKWSWRYIAGVPDPAGEGAISGNKIHKHLERWFKAGTFPSGNDVEARAAIAMAQHLAKQGIQYPQERVEEPFEIELQGVKWRGIRDLVYQDGDALVVHDHKTTSGLQWAKTEEELKEDVQSVLYARVAFEESDVVDLQWLYGTREKNKQKHVLVQQTRFNITRNEVESAMPPIIAAGKRILELYEATPHPNELPANLHLCKAFGGCPYWDVCDLSPLQRAQAVIIQERIKEEKKMGFRDRKAAQQNQTVAAETKAEVAEEPPSRPTMREKLGFGDTVTPPKFERPPVEVEVESQAGVSEESTLAAAALDKPRRGRKPGSKNKPKEDVGIPLEPGQVANTEVPAVEKGNVVAKDNDGFLLCVDCMPSNPEASYTRFSDYVTPVLNTIQARHEVAHYRMIDFKAAGIIAAELFTYIQTNPPVGVLVVDTRSNEGQDCLPTLQRFAKAEFRKLG